VWLLQSPGRRRKRPAWASQRSMYFRGNGVSPAEQLSLSRSRRSFAPRRCTRVHSRSDPPKFADRYSHFLVTSGARVDAATAVSPLADKSSCYTPKQGSARLISDSGDLADDHESHFLVRRTYVDVFLV